MEVVRPAAKMLPYKLFIRCSCFSGAFFTFFAFSCNTEYSNFCINCKCNRPQLQTGRRCRTVAPRHVQICADAADVHHSCFIIIHDAGQKGVRPWPDWPDRFRRPCTHTVHTPDVHKYFAFSLAANVNMFSCSRALAISFQEAVMVVFIQYCNTSSLHLSTPSCGLIFFNSCTGTFK